MIRWAFAITGTLFLLLGGCASPTRYGNALHPQYGQTDFDRDWYECRRENTQPRAEKFGSYAGAEMVVNEDMARQCLAARGWRPVTSSALQSPSTPAPRPAAPTIRPEASASERAFTERFQRAAREMLDKPYYRAPFACEDGVWWSKDNYVLEMMPWVAAAGLQRGDRVLGFGGIPLTRYDAAEAWSKVPHGESVTFRVDRGGKELSIQLPCRDSSQTWQAGVTIFQAIADGQWQACVDAAQAYARLTRVAPASLLYTAAICMRERGKVASQVLPDEYWRMLHAWATKAIEESRYRPTGLTEIRSRLLEVSDSLEKAGRAAWASDVRQQIAAFSQAPATP